MHSCTLLDNAAFGYGHEHVQEHGRASTPVHVHVAVNVPVPVRAVRSPRLGRPYRIDRIPRRHQRNPLNLHLPSSDDAQVGPSGLCI